VQPYSDIRLKLLYSVQSSILCTTQHTIRSCKKGREKIGHRDNRLTHPRIKWVLYPLLSEPGTLTMSEHMEASRSIPLSEAEDGLYISDTRKRPRLSIPFELRLGLGITTSLAAGAILGLSLGAQAAGLRFRAENAHRLPNSSTGWYLYHKSKNYHIALGAVKEGFKMGTKVGFWVGSYFAIEEAIDRARGGRTDFLSSVVAGMSVAGGFSAWSMCPMPGPVRAEQLELTRFRSISPVYSGEDRKDRPVKWTVFWFGSGCTRPSYRTETVLCGFPVRQETIQGRAVRRLNVVH